MKKIFLLLLIFIFLSSCQNSNVGSNLSEPDNNSDITIKEETRSESSQFVGNEDDATDPDINISTPWLSDNEDGSSEETSEGNGYNYNEQEERAESLEIYLRENLSEDDYGGIYVSRGRESAVVSLIIWTVDREKVENIVEGYTEKPFEINYFEANCSYRKLKEFAEEIEKLNGSSDRKVIAILSEEGNYVAINLFQDTYDELSDDISEIIQKHSMPDSSWKIVILSSEGENPNT